MTATKETRCKVRFEPSGLKVEVPRGATLLEAARLAGVYLSSLCGGDGTCGKCKVQIGEGEASQTVLACQMRVDGDLTVTVSEDHRLDTGRILVGVDTHPGAHAAAAGAFPFDPPVPPVSVPGQNPFGVAVDVGTTTVVAHLLDYGRRETLGAEAVYNTQMKYGDDYIRRIMYAEQHDGWKDLQADIVHDINNLVFGLCLRYEVPAEAVTAIVCAGNTAMLHFLWGLEAGWIRRGLVRPDALVLPPRRACEVGLRIHDDGQLLALPAVGAYVGADIVAGVLATRLYEAEGLSLLIDIGTNGEIVLGGREWMACASSSAGPAFEGSGIRHGMRAAAGAIERCAVAADGTLRFQTVGGEPARGLCGSGLLDLLASLLEAGLIDRTGRFAHPEDPRIADGADGPEMTLVPAADDRPAIVITQADIANLIRSKAGVYAAIAALLESTGTRAESLETIYVAGGFGNYLDPRKAIEVGLLPDVPLEKIRFVGNTSIAGAKMAAMSRAALAKAGEIAGRMTYIDLMNHPGYMEAFIQANFLPHTDLARFPSVRRRAAGAPEKESPP